MKIFNDFDTKGQEKEHQSAIDKYWKDNVIVINRTIAYWIMKWIIPCIIYISIAVFLLYISIVPLAEYSIISWILIWIVTVFTLGFINFIVNIYIDYKLDYTIITKAWIFTYKQIWFFNSKSKDLPANKIRSIEAQRFWILGNIFWFGNIVIVTDGWMLEKDENWSHIWGKSKITYISRPQKATKKIIALCLADR